MKKIARIWHGRTKAIKADEYFEYLQKTGVKDYRSLKGNKGVSILRRIKDDEAEFLIISFWESFNAIKKFAGDRYELARYYPEDEKFLLEFEPIVNHYEVLL